MAIIHRRDALRALPLSVCLLGAACSGDDGGAPAAPVAESGSPASQGTTTDAGTAPRSDAGSPVDDDSPDSPPPDAGSPDDAADGGAPDVPTEPVSSCLGGISSFDEKGPFTFEAKTAGRIKMWVPAVPAGCKVPVLHFANGTGATCGIYQAVLDRLASHGFLTTCYEDTNTGAGSQGLEALELAYETYPELADTKIGSLGHSQGGQGALTVLELAERTFGAGTRYAGLAMQPASGFGEQPAGGSWQEVYGRIRSPVFMFSGTADILVSEAWVARGFAALADDVEAYNWSAEGSTHIPTPDPETMEVSVAWFRWKLLGDAEACRYFKALPEGERWTVTSEQNAAACP